MKKRIITFIMLVLAVLSIAVPASAASENLDMEPVQPRYTYIDAVGAKISINSSGLASCTGVGYAKGTYDTVDLTVYLQQYKNGTWTTLQTWTGSGTNMAVVSGEYYVYKGYKYRTKTSMIVYDENGKYLNLPAGHKKQPTK